MLKETDDARLCSCEEIARCDYGVVDDAEPLARVVCNPRHIKKNGKVKPSVIGQKDVKERGLSLIRLNYLQGEALAEQVNAIAETVEGNSVAGFLVAEARELRAAVRDNKERALCVFDDPTEKDGNIPANPAHALAVASVLWTEDEVVRIRTQLIKLFGDLRRIGEV